MSMKGGLYVPVVKGKKNDLVAVSRLSDGTKKIIHPLIELMPLPSDTSVEDHVKKFVTYVQLYYPAGPAFVDMYGLIPGQLTADGKSALFYAFLKLHSVRPGFIPMYGFERDDSVWPRITRMVSAIGSGFAFRIDHDDLDDLAEETWVNINDRTSELGLPASSVDLVLDLRFIGDRDPEQIALMVSSFLTMQPLLGAYRSISMVGSSALKMVSSIPKDGIGEVDRVELSAWLKLSEMIDSETRVQYGDYGVIHPEFSDIGPSPNANAKIRCTSGSKIHYFRGHRLFKPSDFPQYVGLARKVVGHKTYKGPNFSFGSSYVEAISTGISGTGNLGTWVACDLNHHFEAVSRQMAAVAGIKASADELEGLISTF